MAHGCCLPGYRADPLATGGAESAKALFGDSIDAASTACKSDPA